MHVSASSTTEAVAGDAPAPAPGTRRKRWFWRRLAGGWIDLFAIYALASCLSFGMAAVRVRIAFGLLFLLVGVAYTVALTARWGRTLGKMLTGLTIIARDSPPNASTTLLRELAGKWGLTVVLPVVVARMLIGAAWVPTIADFGVIMPVLFISAGYCLITRRCWHDQLAGTMLDRTTGQRPARAAFLALFAAAALAFGCKAADFLANGWIPCRLGLYQSTRSTAPHIRFLSRQKMSDVDYVIGLFDRYDVVVLCERLHPRFHNGTSSIALSLTPGSLNGRVLCSQNMGSRECRVIWTSL